MSVSIFDRSSVQKPKRGFFLCSFDVFQSEQMLMAVIFEVRKIIFFFIRKCDPWRKVNKILRYFFCSSHTHTRKTKWKAAAMWEKEIIRWLNRKQITRQSYFLLFSACQLFSRKKRKYYVYNFSRNSRGTTQLMYITKIWKL